MRLTAPSAPSPLSRRLVFGLGAYVAIGGLVSFLGWAMDVPRLTDWDAQGVSVQPNAALAAAVAGLAVMLTGMGQRLPARVGAVVVAAVGAATLFEHVTGLSLGIDQLLRFGRSWGMASTVAPGRMGVPAALAWTLCGTALLLVQSPPTRRHASLLGVCMLVISGLALTGYLFGATVLYAVPQFTTVALQMATFIFAGGLALIACAPAVEPMRTLLADSSAGMMVRQTLPFVVVLPFVLGYVRVAGERRGLYYTATGTALLVLVLVGLLCALLWRGARAVRLREIQLEATRQSRARADSARIEAEGKIVALIDGIDDGFAAFDSAWRYTYLNSAGERVIARPRTEVLGEILWNVFPEILGTDMERCLREAASGRKAVEFESWNPGVGRWFSNRAYPIPAGGVAVYFRDLTEVQRAQQSLVRAQQELLVTTDNAPVMLAHCDAAGRYLFVNEPYAARFRRTREEIVGRTLPEVVGEASYRRFAHHVAAVLAGQEARFEMPIPRGAAGPEVLHVAFTPERDSEGNVVGLVAALIDITDRKRAEDALRDADRRKDEFLATLSHELRNPLAPITTCIEILRRAGGDPTLADRTVATLDRQVRHMVRLVDDLLDVSRITRNTLTLRAAPVELTDVVRHAVEAFLPLAEARHQSVAVSMDAARGLVVLGDLARLVQIMGNLLSNAGRYSDVDSRISVNVASDSDSAVITVTDHGLGIAADKLESIFEPFTQLHPALERSQGGLGIGLSLARRLAELHGGTLVACSGGEGEGSQFVLRLPLAQARS